MGLDLALLPFDFEHEILSYSHSVLSCERRSALFRAIATHCLSDQKQVPSNFASYLGRGENEEHAYGKTLETPYGDPLFHVSVENLLRVSSHKDVLDNSKNRAIWAYLKELPPETRVALYWS